MVVVKDEGLTSCTDGLVATATSEAAAIGFASGDVLLKTGVQLLSTFVCNSGRVDTLMTESGNKEQFRLLYTHIDISNN